MLAQSCATQAEVTLVETASEMLERILLPRISCKVDDVRICRLYASTYPRRKEPSLPGDELTSLRGLKVRLRTVALQQRQVSLGEEDFGRHNRRSRRALHGQCRGQRESYALQETAKVLLGVMHDYVASHCCLGRRTSKQVTASMICNHWSLCPRRSPAVWIYCN